MAELLFELGSEELPARFVGPALDDLERLFTQACAAQRISHGPIGRFGTPRRLAIIVEAMAAATADVTKELVGPSVKAAFDAEGKPKVAAIKFAEGAGVSVEQLRRVSTPKGEYLAAVIDEKGRRVIELLPEVLGACLRKLTFPKSMRWGDVEQSFARPLHWIVALLDQEVIPLVYADVRSGRVTRGHRFLAPGPITLASPKEYETALEKAYVIASIPRRLKLLKERVEAAAVRAQGALLHDADLEEQVVNLVEQPHPVVGVFEAQHLDLPPEVLIQEMRGHQRYFSLVDARGALIPKFIAVSNTPVKDEKLSVKGYERVLRARLTDARFFFDEDRRTPLADRVTRLHRRTWVAALGNMAEKTDRIRALAMLLCDRAGLGASRAALERAATLCKADLETGMVGEFPELQGVMGREYALAAGEPRDVAVAIFEHYLPRGAGDGLPMQDPGALIGLADRFDSLCGLFAIGKKPTGAKDDFALRRAAIGILRIILARGYRFSLGAAVDEALGLFEAKLAEVKKRPQLSVARGEVMEFFRGRLESLWRENHRADVVEAVLAKGFDDVVATAKRLEALSASVSRADFGSLVATFKRVANIVEKQAQDVAAAPVDPALLIDAAEKALHAEVQKVRAAVVQAAKRDEFDFALGQVLPLKASVDVFFDKVMVMAEDRKVRENRVRLLMDIGSLFGTVADFSKLQAEG